MDYSYLVVYTAVIMLFLSLTVIKIQSLSLSEPMVALIAGLLAGPFLLDFLHVKIELQVLKIVSEITVALAVMSGALKVPGDYILKKVKPISILLFIIMPGMWFLTAAGVLWILPGFTLSSALLLGAILSPTDPVVSSTIITGRFAEKYFPEKLRNTISFESGANDGLAYPFVFASLFLFNSEDESISGWVINTLFYKNVLAIGLGLTCGYVFGKLFHYTHKKQLMSMSAYHVFTLMLTISILFLCNILNMNGIISIFAAGIVFNLSTDRNEEEQMFEMQETFERLLTIPVFVMLGYVLPINSFYELGLPLILVMVFILFLRRIPVIHALGLLKSYRNEKELLLLGWFGPIGIAALYYSLEIKELTGYAIFFEITAFAILVSTIIHGLTGLPLSKLYKKSMSPH